MRVVATLDARAKGGGNYRSISGQCGFIAVNVIFLRRVALLHVSVNNLAITLFFNESFIEITYSL
ncbi:hypothetical protein [Sodalis glossinidius]|uniref:hypothetical protein n=1 Tax=Sodalis glossinidius TaxID=63612 RepID=UPI0011D0C04D|nr:hypothetical protein [Sodalis glossinidius]